MFSNIENRNFELMHCHIIVNRPLFIEKRLSDFPLWWAIFLYLYTNTNSNMSQLVENAIVWVDFECDFPFTVRIGVFIFIQLKTNRALKKSFAVSLERLAPNLNIQTCWMREKKRQLKTKAWTIIESKILMTWFFFSNLLHRLLKTNWQRICKCSQVIANNLF